MPFLVRGLPLATINHLERMETELRGRTKMTIGWWYVYQSPVPKGLTEIDSSSDSGKDIPGYPLKSRSLRERPPVRPFQYTTSIVF